MYADYTILTDGVLFNDSKIYNSDSVSSKKIKYINDKDDKDNHNNDKDKDKNIKTNLKKKEIINDDNYLFLFYC